MDDLISRQAAIDTICETCDLTSDYHKCNGYPVNSTWCDYMVAIRALPSAERHGRWEKMDGTDLWCCSVCGNTIYSEDETDRERFHKWCGRCGAKMDEVTEPRYCDRNICASNEVNGIGCDECPVMMDEEEE